MKSFDDLLKVLAQDDTDIANDDKAIVDATAALSKANLDLKTANETRAEAITLRALHDAAVAAEVSAGPRFVGPAADGSISVYLTNPDGKGYHVVTALPAAAPVAGEDTAPPDTAPPDTAPPATVPTA